MPENLGVQVGIVFTAALLTLLAMSVLLLILALTWKATAWAFGY